MSRVSIFAELKRRNVLRAAAFYAASAWLLVQVATQVFPFFHIAEWVVRWIVIAAVIGFPLLLAFAWFYEITPEGLKRESEIEPHESITHHTGKKLDRAIIGVLLLVVVVLLSNQFVLHRESAGAATPDALAVIPEKSIAVLPLSDESGNKDDLYFSDGLSEDLITALSQFEGLKVISRNSSFEFRGSEEDSKSIGARLGVAHLLEGSVRRSGDTVRISATLVKAVDGSTVWSHNYDRPYQDLFKLQDEITTIVAAALKAKLLVGSGVVMQTDRPPSGNLDAYNAYLQGKFHDAGNTEADDLKAVDYFNDAIRLDPRYARAWASLSQLWTSHAAQYLTGAEMSQAYAKAREAADAALSLDPNLAAAHIARAYVLKSADFDWDGADAEFRRALQLAPEDATTKYKRGVLLATMGQPELAVTLTQEALVESPLNAIWYNWLSQYQLALDHLDEAEKSIRKAIALQPNAESQYETLAIIEVKRGDFSAALRAAEEESAGVWQDTAMALAQQISGDQKAADAALKNLIDKNGDNGAYQIAEVYALRNDPENMFAWLERAWTLHDPGISSLLIDPFLMRYRTDARFAAFCMKVGLPVPGVARSALAPAVPAA